MIAIEKNHNISWEWLQDYMNDENINKAPGPTSSERHARRVIKREVEAQNDVPWRDVKTCLPWLAGVTEEHHRKLRTGPRKSLGDPNTSASELDGDSETKPTSSSVPSIADAAPAPTTRNAAARVSHGEEMAAAHHRLASESLVANITSSSQGSDIPIALRSPLVFNNSGYHFSENNSSQAMSVMNTTAAGTGNRTLGARLSFAEEEFLKRMVVESELLGFKESSEILSRKLARYEEQKDDRVLRREDAARH